MAFGRQPESVAASGADNEQDVLRFSCWVTPCNMQLGLSHYAPMNPYQRHGGKGGAAASDAS